LDRVILHTVMHHSSTSTYITNFITIEESFCGRTDGRTFETHFIRSTRSRPKNGPFQRRSSQPFTQAGTEETEPKQNNNRQSLTYQKTLELHKINV